MSAVTLDLTKVGLDDTFNPDLSGVRARLDPGFVDWLNEMYGPVYTNLYFDEWVDDPSLFSENISFEHMKSPSKFSPAYASWKGTAFAYPHEAYQLQIVNAIFRMLQRDREALVLLHGDIGSDIFNYAMRYAREIVFLSKSPFVVTGDDEIDTELASNNMLMLLSYVGKTAFNQRNTCCSISVYDWSTQQPTMIGTLVRK